MSILIKGMEMPEEHTLYTLTIFPNGYVAIYDAKDSFIGETKAVTVPPHGRLIDADAFFDDLLFPSKQFEQGMRELVGDAPTVIPAEEDT